MTYGFMSQLDQFRPGESLSLWLPGESVVCYQVDVPAVSAPKWRAMIPWLLEEQLLAPPESLAFFPGRRQGNRVPVLVVAADRLAEWRDTLRARDLQCDRLVPDYFALPWQPGEISLLRQGNRILVRYGQWQGCAGSESFIWPLLTTLDDGQVTLRLFCDHPIEVPDPWRQRVQAQSAAGLFAGPAGQWLDIPGNVHGHKRAWSKSALAAGVAGVAAVVLWGGAWALENQRITRQADHFQRALEQGYQAYFGERYDDALADFQSVVSRQLDGGGGKSLTLLLDRLSAVMARCGDCRLHQLSGDDSGLIAQIDGDHDSLAIAGAVSAGADGGWRLTLRAEDVR